MRIVKAMGSSAKLAVETFLHANGSRAVARPDDLFFLAYENDEIIGSVRFCVEEKTPMLRTMMIGENARRRGVGSQLLDEFRSYLDQNEIHDVYCIPYSHLLDFYSQIGFSLIDESKLPEFLQARLVEYRSKSPHKVFAAMKR
jgi:N-acetylglutamate synthase-like GNAT family acetyltransferase